MTAAEHLTADELRKLVEQVGVIAWRRNAVCTEQLRAIRDLLGEAFGVFRDVDGEVDG